MWRERKLQEAFDQARALRESAAKTREEAEWMNVVALDVMNDAEQTLSLPVDEDEPSPA